MVQHEKEGFLYRTDLQGSKTPHKGIGEKMGDEEKKGPQRSQRKENRKRSLDKRGRLPPGSLGQKYREPKQLREGRECET